MINFIVWGILGIATVILLAMYFKKRNAVWGGFTLGIVIGLIIALIFIFKGDGFSLYIIGKAAALGTIVGFIAELLGKLSGHIKSKQK